VFVNISQRLHIADLSGALIKMPGFKLLKISAIAQQDEIYPESHGQEWSRGHGNILQESLKNEATLSALRTAMGNPAFSAQYLQEPIPEGGGAFSFNRFTRLAKQPRGVVFLSIDTGQTKGGGDYTVIMTIGYQNERYHILDIYRDQVDFEGLRIAVLQKIQTEKPVGVIIETTGGYGEALRQTLHNCHGIQNLFRFNANMSKQERFHVIWPMIQAGDVTIPESATWLLDFRKELISFPAGKHDDQLDALSQYLISADFHIRKVGFDPPRKYCKHIWNVTSHGFG
jgi:predicted phage terminase large subunit-like protein